MKKIEENMNRTYKTPTKTYIYIQWKKAVPRVLSNWHKLGIDLHTYKYDVEHIVCICVQLYITIIYNYKDSFI